MRRILLAGMLALPLVLAMVSSAQAQGPGCGMPGGNCGPGYGSASSSGYSVRYRLFSCLHQDGPLVNYGPYSGYYPFEPYGPWTADLRYTGPLTSSLGGGTAATGRLRLNEISGGGFGGFGGFGGVRHSPGGTCSSGHTWGSYSLATLKNIGHRINPWHHRGNGVCSTCHSAVQPAEPIHAASLSVTER